MTARLLDGHRGLLAIDPGLSGTGWAVWRASKVDFLPSPVPDAVGVLRKSFPSFIDNSNWLADMLYDAAFDGRLDRGALIGGGDYIVSCEFPEFQAGASRSMGWRSGDLQKLTYLVGVLGRAFREHTFEAVPVHQWKGQLPKALVEKRIRHALGEKACNRLGIKTHAWDAVGIGLWRLGVFA